MLIFETDVLITERDKPGRQNSFLQVGQSSGAGARHEVIIPNFQVLTANVDILKNIFGAASENVMILLGFFFFFAASLPCKKKTHNPTRW